MEYGLVVIWLVTFLTLGLVALPVAALLCRRLPARGAGVAMPVALVLVTLPAFWVGQVAFGLPALLVGLVVLVGTSAAAWRRLDGDLDWGAVADTAVVFTVAFGFMVAVRAVDPAVHPIAGEKFLDYGMLKALLRSSTLPPEDFWFAGEPVAYYYGGHLMAALLSLLTGTAANYAYNLALAGFYAMYVTAAYGVAGAIGTARGTTRRGAGLAGAFFVAFASNLATPARGLAGFLPTSLLGTVAPEKAEEFAEGLSAFSYWPASRAMKANVITEFPLFAYLNGDLHAHMMSPPFTLLVAALLVAYVRTPEEEIRRRRLLVFGCVPLVSGLLAFVSTWATFTPAGLVALTLYFAPADPTTLLPATVGRPLRTYADGAVTAGDGTVAANGGAGGAVAEREHPVRMLLADAERTLRVEGVRGLTAAVGAVAVLLVGFVFVLPFLTGSASTREVAIWEAARRSDIGGMLVVHGGFLAVVAVFLRERFRSAERGSDSRVLVPLAVVLVVGTAHDFAAFGLLVPPMLVAWLLLRGSDAHGDADKRTPTVADGGADEDDAESTASSGEPPLSANRSGPETTLLAVGNAVQTVGLDLLVLGAAYLVVDTLVGFVLPWLAGVVGGGTPLAVADVGLTVLGTAWVLVELGWPGIWVDADDSPPAAPLAVDRSVGFETVLFVGGAGLVLIVEVVYVVENAAPGRFNTVFKTYSQVWALWAPAAGVMLVAALRRHLPAAAVGGRAGRDDVGPSLTSRFAVGAALLLVLSLSLYGGLAMTNHFTGNSASIHQRVDDPTLDATAFVQSAHPEEAPAIRWLDRRQGTPTIVTAPGLYRWRSARGKGANAPASLTGLPTVVGWAHHERGFRGSEAGVSDRVADVNAIYEGSTAERACLLVNYDVQYVYVGPAERNRYRADAVDELRSVPGVSVQKTFSEGAVVIYGVDQDQLPDGGDC
jgi:YYY domain-containing protein